jgi:putative ABC transport system permease protein
MILFESILDGFADIRNNLGRTLLQLTGVILGVGSIVATFALAAAGKEMSQKFYKISGGIEKISIRNKPLGKVTLDAKALASKGLTFTDVEAIQQHAKHIDLVSPVSNEDMNIRYLSTEKEFDVMGVMPAFGPMNDFRAERGRFISDSDVSQAQRVVVFGSKRARQIFSTDDPIGKTVTMNGTGYLVVGVMEEKYFTWDQEHNALEWMNEQIFVPITTLMTRQGQTLSEGKVSWMHVRMRDVKVADEAVEELKTILRREHGVGDFEVFSRVERLKQNEENDKMYDITFMVCGLISLFVGGVVVMNIQLASFNERIREVGTRKAVGASSIHIFTQFMVESLLVAGFGGLIGLVVGKGFTSGIAALTKNPATITPQVVVTALIFAAGTGIVFGLYPAIKASRLHPIEALRTE